VSRLGDGELETAVQMDLAVRSGEVTASELVERCLDRAEAWQDSTNAFSQPWADHALGEAARRAAVPLAVKDLFDVAGFETTGCSALYRGRRAEADAPVIASVRARTVLVGKTNQHELAAGGTNLVSACGRTGNPWDPGRMTGGSSGGSAAAVAAAVVPWALGSDTGGSIRIPSSMCGTFGLKPTTGRLSIAGMLPLAPSMDCPGPIAATAADLAFLFELMGGERATDASPDGFRIGLPGGIFADRVHDEVRAVVRSTGDLFESLGATIEPSDEGLEDDVRGVWMRVCTPEFADAHPDAFERRDLVEPSVLGWFDMGARMTGDERRQAGRDRERIRRWFLGRLERFDVLLVPTTPYPAPRADQQLVDLGVQGTVDVGKVGPGWLTCSVNLANLPAVNLPSGWSSDGLPIGVSLVGRPDADATLLGLAARWEEATDYRPRRPRRPDESEVRRTNTTETIAPDGAE
jgi:aspartyl-tRNA(Asn)/glutamyl-tRNA(Gln) amidotransferase subunit A